MPWVTPIWARPNWKIEIKIAESSLRRDAQDKNTIVSFPPPSRPPPPFAPSGHSAANSHTQVWSTPYQSAADKRLYFSDASRANPGQDRRRRRKKKYRDYLARLSLSFPRNGGNRRRMAKSTVRKPLRNGRPVARWPQYRYGTGGTPAPHFSALSQATGGRANLTQLAYSYLSNEYQPNAALLAPRSLTRYAIYDIRAKRDESRKHGTSLEWFLLLLSRD